MRPVIGASWKMHLTPTQAVAYLDALLPLLVDVADRDLFVLPAFPSIPAVRDRLAGTNVAWGAQDVHPDDEGAHTGDVSAPMLADLGSSFVAVGHPERRRDHGETPELVARKVAAVLRWGMSPVVCMGEEQKGTTNEVIAIVGGQLDRLLGSVAPEDLGRVVVAYEPAWAIGTGAAAADPSRVAAVHASIHAWCLGRGEAGSAGPTRVIYGGSVDTDAAADLLGLPLVDGLFVGRASLDPGVFARIAHVPIAAAPWATPQSSALTMNPASTSSVADVT
jgi:triosephosphate isomerase (TIM)